MEEEMMAELKESGVDVEKAIARFAGRQERYIKYMKLHVEQEVYDKLLEALHSDDFETAERYSHTLKGDFRSFEFSEIAPVMVRINEILKSGNGEGVEELINSINSKYRHICRVIKKF